MLDQFCSYDITNTCINAKKGMIITHKCTKCGAERNNKMQSDDNTELLIRLTNPYNREED